MTTVLTINPLLFGMEKAARALGLFPGMENVCKQYASTGGRTALHVPVSDNLAYGTRSENLKDRVRLGTHHNAAKTHCARGHEFTAENTMRQRSGRRCRQCKRDEGRAFMRAKREKERARLCQVRTTTPAK